MTDPAAANDPRIPAQIAQQFIGLTDQFLCDQLGRAYTVPEMLQFSETAVATLMASAYANFREAVGKEQAEAWLKKTLSVSASIVRLLGADALVKFDVVIKDMPNKLRQHRMEPPPPAPPAEEAKCVCQVDKDGTCPSCVEKLSLMLRGSFKLLNEMRAYNQKAVEYCPVCSVTQTDRALATLIPDLISMRNTLPKESHEIFNQEGLAVLHQMGAMAGVRDIPFTEKYWHEAVKA